MAHHTTQDATPHRRLDGTTRRRLGLILAPIALVLLVLGGAMTWASASDEPASHHVRPHRIHLVTTLTSVAINPAGLGGPADVVAQVFAFSTPSGGTGHIDASTTLVSSSEQLSHVAFVLPDGQIDAQAAITLPPTHFVAAITGGTLAYEGVSGQVVNNVISTSPLTIDRTLYLIYPDDQH